MQYWEGINDADTGSTHLYGQIQSTRQLHSS
jgi:hypothetical protein